MTLELVIGGKTVRLEVLAAFFVKRCAYCETEFRTDDPRKMYDSPQCYRRAKRLRHDLSGTPSGLKTS